MAPALPGRRLRRVPLLLLTASLVLAGAGKAGASALADYVAAPDPTLAWEQRAAGRYRGTDYVELRLSSQTWRDIRWQHRLFVIRPPGAVAGQPALLFVSGGRWKPEYAEAAPSGELPGDAALFAEVAHRLKAPVAVLGQVPFQPMFEGRREDALIAYTFDRFLVTREPDWPLLLPMVKATQAAMTAVQAVTREAWQLPVDRFIVAGASKRGWTTWLAAATGDPRVAGIAPMVIDVLDMPRQMAHQTATWGRPSVQIQDYVDLDLTRRILEPGGEALLASVDPWRYRATLTQPKLIVLATNDAYWPVDAAGVYLDGIPGSNRLLYLPNNGHSVTDVRRLVAGFGALHRAVSAGESLPALEWTHAGASGRAELRFRSTGRPARARAWFARSPGRDFRAARWLAKPVRRDGDGWYRFVATGPDDYYLAVYGEAEYGLGDDRYFLSTGLRVIGPDGVVPLAAAPTADAVSRFPSAAGAPARPR